MRIAPSPWTNKIVKACGDLARGCLLIATASLAVAAQADTSWQRVFEPYPRSEVLVSEERQVVDYPIALGKVSKRQQVWATEKQLRADGKLLRRAVQMPDGHSAEEAFRHYHRGLQALDTRILFQCDGRNCGPSNAWANEVFEIKQLYGQDGEQFFATYELTDDDQHLHYVMLYSVVRGNKRVYAHIEWLQTERAANQAAAPDPGVIKQQLANQGYYLVSGVSLEAGELAFQQSHLQAVVEALRGLRRQTVRIVGHDYSRQPLNDQLQQSLDYAEQLAAALVDAGVDESLLETHGVGSLAPRHRALASERQARRQQPLFRVELVAVD